GLLARFCERPQFVYRVAPVKPKHAVARSLAGQVLLRADPARVNVDCPGPVREDVPSHGFLGEGLTGENDRLKRGLECRAELLSSRQPFAVGEAAPRADPRHRIAPSTFTVKVDPSRLT